MAPAGDQPEAISALVEGVAEGDKFQTLLGITGSGKSFTIANVIAQAQRPTLVLAPNKSLAAQLAAEFREFFPQQPGRVLRLLLRLLPARGVHPVVRHVHREGQLDQRRDRPAAPLGHERAADPPRRDHRRVGVGDLRARFARDVREAAADARRRRGARPALDPAPARRAAATSATTSRSPATSSACGATRSRCSRRTRSGRCASSSSATRSSASARSTRSPARSSRSSTRSRCSRRRTTRPTRSG